MPGAPSAHARAKRGQITGWSIDAVRRHTQWLYSVLGPALTGWGFALTLTMRECPPTSRDFHAMRRAFLMRLQRTGHVVRLHWVVEWTRRKVPHMHMAVYLSAELSRVEFERIVRAAWLGVAQDYGTVGEAQMVKTIYDSKGWSAYTSKHAARGVGHYQRQGKPSGWETTGRLWGFTGDWPTRDASRWYFEDRAWFAARRIVRGWRLADAQKALRRAQEAVARAQGSRELRDAQKALRTALGRITAARRVLQHPDPRVSVVRGLSEWIDGETLERLAVHLQRLGYDVREVVDLEEAA
jgi:hypothetical protein